MQSDIVGWLFNWQTLIGAIIGGAMGFIGAWLVAHNARVRDEIVSGRIIVADLLSIQERTHALDELVSSITEDKNKKREFALQYIKRKPILSPLFDTYMGTVMSCSYQLSVHLALFRKIYLNVDESLTKVADKVSKAEATKEKIEITSYFTADIETIYKGAHHACQLATCIIPFLEKDVFSNFRYINRFNFCSVNCNCHLLIIETNEINGKQTIKSCHCCSCCEDD